MPILNETSTRWAENSERCPVCVFKNCFTCYHKTTPFREPVYTRSQISIYPYRNLAENSFSSTNRPNLNNSTLTVSSQRLRYERNEMCVQCTLKGCFSCEHRSKKLNSFRDSKHEATIPENDVIHQQKTTEKIQQKIPNKSVSYQQINVVQSENTQTNNTNISNKTSKLPSITAQNQPDQKAKPTTSSTKKEEKKSNCIIM